MATFPPLPSSSAWRQYKDFRLRREEQLRAQTLIDAEDLEELQFSVAAAWEPAAAQPSRDEARRPAR